MEPQELVEHRYRAVLEVLDGAPVVEVALRYGVSRQSVHTWRNRYREHGVERLKDRSRRPRTSPTRLPADVEALICELRQQHPRWGARRVVYELGRRSVIPMPSRATVHRVLARNGLVDHQQQEHKRKYRRWQRDAPMQLWQMDIVSGVPLADGRECKLVTGIDDHSRFIVVAEVLVRPTGRDVCSAFVAAMQRYGVPTEMLTDNGKQFTGRFTKRPGQLRCCSSASAGRTASSSDSPNAAHQPLRARSNAFTEPCAASSGPCGAVRVRRRRAGSDQRLGPQLQPRPTAPVPRHGRSGEPLLAFPRRRGCLPADRRTRGCASPAAQRSGDRNDGEPGQRPGSLGAIEFDREVPPCGHFALFHGGQDIWVGPAFAGRTITVWADDRSIHVTMEGYLLKTFASRTSLEDLARIRDKLSGRPAGPPPAAPALPRHRGRPQLPPGTAVEVDRAVTRDGVVGLGDRDVMLSRTLAGSRVVLRMDEHLLHVISGGRVVKTMPLPIPAGRLPLLKGVRTATEALPPSGPIGPVTVQRLVNGNGRVMVAGQYMRIGAVHSGKVVNVIVEDTHFRIVYDGEELAVHPRTSDKAVTRVKAWPSRQSRPPRQTSHEDGASSKS